MLIFVTFSQNFVILKLNIFLNILNFIVESEDGMDFEIYIHTTEELLKLFGLIDDKYDNWTEEQEEDRFVSLDEFYQKRGFMNYEDFSITKTMYDMTANQIEINDSRQNTETNNGDIQQQRRQILNKRRRDFYEYIRVCLFSGD